MKPIQAETFEAIFKQSKIPIVILRADKPFYTIVAFNQSYKETTRSLTTNLIGKGAFEVYNPVDNGNEYQFKLLLDALNKCYESKEPLKLPAIYFEGSEKDSKRTQKSWWQIQIIPILNQDKEVEHFMCFTLNITQKELTRQALEESKNSEQVLNQEFRMLNEALATTNEELHTTNEEFASTNEELHATNEELNSSMEELRQSQDALYVLNCELEDRIVTRTAALAESENRYRSMLNALPQIAWTNDLSGDVNFYNKRWYDYTGLTYEQSMDWGWKAVIHPDDLDYNLDCFSSILKSKKKGEFEIREKGADGIYKWHLIRMEPILDELGQIQSWIGTATDIEHLKQLEQQKDDFINIASHELKTPLTSLKGSLQLLNRMKGDLSIPMVPKLIEQANKDSNRVTTLVDNLLNVNRINNGQLNLHKSLITLSDLIEDCCQYVRLEGKFNIITKGDKSLQIYVDTNQINQVLVNLINNAIKYASGSKDINVHIEKVHNMAKVSVSDEGPGIPSEKIPHLFDRYYQADKTGFQYSGLGLGLYISAEIIKRHKGQIGVSSKVDEGSTFWFTIPLQV